MNQPAHRPDLRTVGLTDEWARRANDHNTAAAEDRLWLRAQRIADQRVQGELRRYDRAMDVLEAEQAWRVATGQQDPYVGTLDAAGYPTMTEQEWVERHGSHPSSPPLPPSTDPSTGEVDGDDGEEVEPAGRHSAIDRPVVPLRKRGEPADVWAARVLSANPGIEIGWKRLSTLVGGTTVLTEGPARRIVKAYRAAVTA